MNFDNISRLDSIFYNGNGALAKLTKIRCSVRNTKALNEVKRCIKLYSWPLPFEKNEYIIRHLNEL